MLGAFLLSTGGEILTLLKSIAKLAYTKEEDFIPVLRVLMSFASTGGSIFLARPVNLITVYFEWYPTAPGDKGDSLQACSTSNSNHFNFFFPSSFWKALVPCHCFFGSFVVFSKRLLC